MIYFICCCAKQVSTCTQQFRPKDPTFDQHKTIKYFGIKSLFKQFLIKLDWIFILKSHFKDGCQSIKTGGVPYFKPRCTFIDSITNRTSHPLHRHLESVGDYISWRRFPLKAPFCQVDVTLESLQSLCVLFAYVII